MSSRVLVTGGSGFLGRPVVEALRSGGFSVSIYDLVEPQHFAGISFIKGSVTDRDLLKRSISDRDAVLHLAGILGTSETIEKAYETAEVNILGTINVLDAAKEHGTSFLYVSKPNYWQNPYTITKIAAEQFSLMYLEYFNMDVRIVRCFNVYGPGQRTEEGGYKKAVPTFILDALQGKPITIYGNGKQTVDLMYVDDAAEAIVAVFKSDYKSRDAVEIGSGVEISVMQLAQDILRLTGSRSSIILTSMRAGENEHTRIRAKTSVLNDKIGYLPKTTLEIGLRQTIDYYRGLIER